MAPLSVCAVVLPAPTKKLGGLSEVAKRQLAEELAHKDVVIFAMIESSLVLEDDIKSLGNLDVWSDCFLATGNAGSDDTNPTSGAGAGQMGRRPGPRAMRLLVMVDRHAGIETADRQWAAIPRIDGNQGGVLAAWSPSAKFMAVFAHLDGPETDDAVALRVQTMVDAEAYLASTVEGGEEGLASYRTIVAGGFKFGSLDEGVSGTSADGGATAAEDSTHGAEIGAPDPLERRRRFFQTDRLHEFLSQTSSNKATPKKAGASLVRSPSPSLSAHARAEQVSNPAGLLRGVEDTLANAFREPDWAARTAPFKWSSVQGWPDRVLYRGFEAASVSTGVLLPTERVSSEAILPTDDDGDDKNERPEAGGEEAGRGQGEKQGAANTRMPVWATMLIPDRPATPTPPKRAPVSPTAAVIPAQAPVTATAAAAAAAVGSAQATTPAQAAAPAAAPSAPLSPLQKFMDKVQSGSPKARPSPVTSLAPPVVPKLHSLTKPPDDPMAATKQAPNSTAPEPSVGWKAVEAKPLIPKVKVSVPADDRTPQPGQLMERVKRLEQETAESERLEEEALRLSQASLAEEIANAGFEPVSVPSKRHSVVRLGAKEQTHPSQDDAEGEGSGGSTSGGQEIEWAPPGSPRTAASRIAPPDPNHETASEVGTAETELNATRSLVGSRPRSPPRGPPRGLDGGDDVMAAAEAALAGVSSPSRGSVRGTPRKEGGVGVVSDAVMLAIKHRFAAATYTSKGQDWGLLLRRVDTDRNGALSLKDMVSLFRRVLKMPPRDCSDEAIKNLFQRIDVDSSGKIAFDELVRWFNPSSTSDARGGGGTPSRRSRLRSVGAGAGFDTSVSISIAEASLRNGGALTPTSPGSRSTSPVASPRGPYRQTEGETARMRVSVDLPRVEAVATDEDDDIDETPDLYSHSHDAPNSTGTSTGAGAAVGAGAGSGAGAGAGPGGTPLPSDDDVVVASFNMNGAELTPGEIERWLGRSGRARHARVVVIALQECRDRPLRVLPNEPASYDRFVAHSNIQTSAQHETYPYLRGRSDVDGNRRLVDVISATLNLQSPAGGSGEAAGFVLAADVAMGEPPGGGERVSTDGGSGSGGKASGGKVKRSSATIWSGFTRLLVFIRMDLATATSGDLDIRTFAVPTGDKVSQFSTASNVNSPQPNSNSNASDERYRATIAQAQAQAQSENMVAMMGTMHNNPPPLPDAYAPGSSPDKGAVAVYVSGVGLGRGLLVVNLHLADTSRYGVLEATYDDQRRRQLDRIEAALGFELGQQVIKSVPMILAGDLNFRVETVEPSQSSSRDEGRVGYGGHSEGHRVTKEPSKTRGGYDYQRARAMAEAPEYPDLLKQLFYDHDRLPKNRQSYGKHLARSNDGTSTASLGASCPALLVGCHDATALAFASVDAAGSAAARVPSVDAGADSAGGGGKAGGNGVGGGYPCPTYPFKPRALSPRKYTDKATPSWTDRVLWRNLISAEPEADSSTLFVEFKVVTDVTVSDHVPVVARLVGTHLLNGSDDHQQAGLDGTPPPTTPAGVLAGDEESDGDDETLTIDSYHGDQQQQQHRQHRQPDHPHQQHDRYGSAAMTPGRVAASVAAHTARTAWAARGELSVPPSPEKYAPQQGYPQGQAPGPAQTQPPLQAVTRLRSVTFPVGTDLGADSSTLGDMPAPQTLEEYITAFKRELEVARQESSDPRMSAFFEALGHMEAPRHPDTLTVSPTATLHASAAAAATAAAVSTSVAASADASAAAGESGTSHIPGILGIAPPSPGATPATAAENLRMLAAVRNAAIALREINQSGSPKLDAHQDRYQDQQQSAHGFATPDLALAPPQTPDQVQLSPSQSQAHSQLQQPSELVPVVAGAVVKLEGRERLAQYRGGLPTDPEERVEVLELLVVEREKKLLRWKQGEMVRFLANEHRQYRRWLMARGFRRWITNAAVSTYDRVLDSFLEEARKSNAATAIMSLCLHYKLGLGQLSSARAFHRWTLCMVHGRFKDRLVVMKGKAKEQIKTVQAQHEAILASTNSLKEQYVKEMETRRQMVTDHERLTAKLRSSQAEAAELNEEVTTLQDTVGQLQRKVLFQRTSGPAP